jgi:hypothetical protein
MSLLLLLISTLQQYWRKEQNRFCLEARRLRGEGQGGDRKEKWHKQCKHI